ncbi:hypothetical protein CVO74_19045 [Xanthomonas prunicola]|uniref:Uncharacterized protein n=2 Tax=Xanthomonas prunicola TaxID=2053930 RepID=A0A2N3RGE8_9XANT|nr:hypothetical protein XpruCFBP8353_17395 [Xanthomonas prunicola]PKV15654.1 hypothetical protein XpruCFBP8354_18515 [Xanthomonas prunicola]PKV19627.1 hypothetical protein CVO74_19045 [Xanthomonas prunicola]
MCMTGLMTATAPSLESWCVDFEYDLHCDAAGMTGPVQRKALLPAMAQVAKAGLKVLAVSIYLAYIRAGRPSRWPVAT